jgi:collagen type III alpha
MLPPEAFEMIGKAVADKFLVYDAKFDAFLARAELKLSSIKDGEPGPKGDTGETGAKGDSGEKGDQGDPGEKGEAGDKGDQGEKGEKGQDGIITTKVAAYRDVWKESEEYELGDFVTWGGSLWHCNSEKTQEKPGTSETWTLAVKRGRDGKDGKSGEKGDPGIPGQKGDKGDIGYA